MPDYIKCDHCGCTKFRVYEGPNNTPKGVIVYTFKIFKCVECSHEMKRYDE